uniref:ATP synthase F0 subunit 8 n=1 Tax=Epophthalmia elegans TaxID=346097 RepID=UPI001436B3C0|nr:ATP synthase F0 subunit 8 [Epophthalmia elegans]QIH29898.1 ATP synthase F0 subunit 8 [Epophthalmia elegans]
MPQMAPMSWSMLFMFFTCMLMIIATMNFFLFKPTIKEKSQTMKMTKTSKNWKW